MFPSFLNTLNPPSKGIPAEIEDDLVSPISRGVQSLSLQDRDEYSIPGAFPSGPSSVSSVNYTPYSTSDQYTDYTDP